MMNYKELSTHLYTNRTAQPENVVTEIKEVEILVDNAFWCCGSI
jgi:hypothetical protein